MSRTRPFLFARIPLALALPVAFLRARRGTRLNTFFTSVTAVATFLSSMLFLLVLAGTHGAEVEITNKLSGLDSHILVRMRRSEKMLCGYEKTEQQLRALHSVIAVAPYLWTDVNLQPANANPDQGPATHLVLKGVLPELESKVSDINSYISSHDLKRTLEQPAPEIPVVIGRRAAEGLGLRINDGIAITKPSEFGVRHFPGRLVGTFDSGTNRDKEVGYTTIGSAATIIGNDRTCVQIIEVRTTDPIRSAATAKTIERALGPDYRAVDWSENYPSYRAVIVLLQRWILILNLVLGFFAAMFSAGAVLLVVYQRRRELAILLTLGTAPAQLRFSVSLVGTVLGLIGVLAALCLDGFACDYMTTHRLVRIPEAQANISFIPFITTNAQLLLVAAIQILMPTFLGWLVAGDLKRVVPAEVLRDE